MKKISDCISPVNWLFVYLGALFAIAVLIQPAFWDYGLILVIDVSAYLFFAKPTQKIFFLLNPKYKTIFDVNFDLTIPQDLSPRKIRESVQLLMSFPRDRLPILFFGSWFKCIPTVIFIVFFVTSPRTRWELLLILLLSFSTNFLFFSAISYFETHQFLSKKLQELIEKNSWNEALLSLDVRLIRNETLIIERIAQAVLFSLGLGLQSFLVWSSLRNPETISSLQIIGATLISYIMFFRFRYVCDRFLLQGLFGIFSYIDRISQMQPDFYLPVHTSGILAKFDLSFNRLLHKVRLADKETTYWMLAEAEKRRFNTIGEMSALMIHDLSGPLNAIRFICNNLSEATSAVPTKKEEYKIVLEENMKRVFELTESLRNRLKSKKDSPRDSLLVAVHESTLRLLETQFYALGISRVQVDFDKQLAGIHIAINNVDLGQVLDNIYRNSIESILQKNEVGRLGIHFVSLEEGLVSFRISDDSSGLNREQFKNMISFHFDAQGAEYKSLGLKLIHKLTEISGGSLSVEESPYYGKGTSFLVSLPVVSSYENEDLYV